MTEAERDRFDEIFEAVLESLPARYAARLDEVSIVLMDQPDADMVDALRRDGTISHDEDGSELCGLHTGVGLTDRSVEDGARLPDQIHLFREGIVAQAGGWETEGESEEEVDDAVAAEVEITLLHELGHHFGLDEDDLDDLGYA